jgi:hypothetical protein
MTTIEIMQADGAGARFTVVVTDEDGSATTHEVTVLVDDWARFGAGFSTTRELVEASTASSSGAKSSSGIQLMATSSS